MLVAVIGALRLQRFGHCVIMYTFTFILWWSISCKLPTRHTVIGSLILFQLPSRR